MTRGYQLTRANAGNHSTSEVWDAGIALVDARESGILDAERCNAAELSKARVQLGCFDKGHATSQRVWPSSPTCGAML